MTLAVDLQKVRLNLPAYGPYVLFPEGRANGVRAALGIGMEIKVESEDTVFAPFHGDPPFCMIHLLRQFVAARKHPSMCPDHIPGLQFQLDGDIIIISWACVPLSSGNDCLESG